MFEIPGAAEEIERRCAGIAQNLEKFGGRRGFRKNGFKNGGEAVGVFKIGGLGSTGIGHRIPESGSPLRRKSVVVEIQKPCRDGGGFHFGKYGSEGRSQAGAGNQIRFFAFQFAMQKGAMDDGFEGNQDPFLVGNGFVEGIDGGVVEAGVIPDRFRKMGGAGGRNEDLNLPFQLMVFCPVEAPERMGTGGRKKGVRAEVSSGEILHEFGHLQGKLVVGLQARKGESRGQASGQIEPADESDRKFRVGFRQKKE